ncbi:MAG: hypothetical protein Q4G25_09290 [Paracoccus sp. (in: a-proteobacteria)]|nr:hypothetical protein [Paracoccus sp. (in: a-proteobacteria)]
MAQTFEVTHFEMHVTAICGPGVARQAQLLTLHNRLVFRDVRHALQMQIERKGRASARCAMIKHDGIAKGGKVAVTLAHHMDHMPVTRRLHRQPASSADIDAGVGALAQRGKLTMRKPPERSARNDLLIPRQGLGNGGCRFWRPRQRKVPRQQKGTRERCRFVLALRGGRQPGHGRPGTLGLFSERQCSRDKGEVKQSCLFAGLFGRAAGGQPRP